MRRTCHVLYYGYLNKMADGNIIQFYTVRDLARLGLWQHAEFYGADFEDNLEVYRNDNKLRYTCTVGRYTCTVGRYTWINLLWDFE